MAVLTNCDYWGSGAANCGGRWMTASPGDTLVAHDDPSARRAARLLGCKLVEVTTGEGGRQMVSGPNGRFPLKGSFPDGLPEAGFADLFACDVAVFGPPGSFPADQLALLEAEGLSVRVYDDRWDSPFAVGRLESAPDIVAALRSARAVVAAGDLERLAWAVGGRAGDVDEAGWVLMMLDWDDEEAGEIRRKALANDSRSARLADVLRAAG